MPNIVEYNAPAGDTSIRPTDIGVTSAMRLATRIGAEYDEAGARIGQGIHQVGQVAEVAEQHAAQKELTTGAALFATTTNNLSQQWNDFLKANPNDPNAAQKFQEQTLEPSIEKFQDGFETVQGKRWAAERTADLTMHFGQRMTHDVSTMAGITATNNVHQYLIQSSQAIEHDPSVLPLMRSSLDSTLDGIIKNSPGLTAEDAEKVKTTLKTETLKRWDESAFYKVAMNDPDQAQKLLESGQFPNVDGKEADGFLKTAKYNQRMEASLARSEQRFQEQEVSDQRAGAWLSHLSSTIAAGQPIPPDTIRSILQDARPGGPLKPTAAMGLIENINHFHDDAERNQAAGVTDPATDQDFRERLALPSTDPRALTIQDVLNASAQNKLGVSRINYYTKMIGDLKKNPAARQDQAAINGFLRNYKSYIAPTTGFGTGNPVAEARYEDFSLTMEDRFNAGRAAGISASDLLTVGKPNYIAADIARFQLTPDQITNGGSPASMAGNAPAPIPVPAEHPQRLPNETPEDYLRRIGGH